MIEWRVPRRATDFSWPENAYFRDQNDGEPIGGNNSVNISDFRDCVSAYEGCDDTGVRQSSFGKRDQRQASRPYRSVNDFLLDISFQHRIFYLTLFDSQ